MKNRYEALLVLNTQGKEDTVKDVVDRLESEFQKEGAESGSRSRDKAGPRAQDRLASPLAIFFARNVSALFLTINS